MKDCDTCKLNFDLMNNNSQQSDSIAIIGLSCRFPGASTPEEFWKVLVEGRDMVGEIPESRIPIGNIYDDDSGAEGKMHQKHGAYLENIHHFDPMFFNISPKEAIEMHPSQKLMLELAWETIERSHVAFDKFKNSKTGVYVGHIWNDFEHFRKERGASINSFSAIGQSANIIASRISYFLGLTGPSFVLDTGCSSSLVAMGLAIQGLRNKTMDMCFCGGINHILNPEQYVYLGKFGGLSSKGRCSSFDASADGFVRAEGAGLFLLKRLSDAIRDHDDIHAVIRGSAINNNGINENLPATSVAGQLDLFRAAYEDAGIDPRLVHYVETHGTGTKIGDPNECLALGEFMSHGRVCGSELRIGSVKSNFGHTEAAAGMAGLLKVVLAMKHRVLPKNLHFVNPNPSIKFDSYNIKIQDTTGYWPVLNGESLKAGVSSFGWGGTNVHLVVEEFVKTDGITVNDAGRKYFALPVSARSVKSLRNYMALYKNELQSTLKEVSLFDICKNSAMIRPHFEFRALAFGENMQEVTASLEVLMQKDAASFEMARMQKDGKVVFIFPGQGSQWLGMGRQLFENESVFREAIQQCDLAFQKYVDWSLVTELFAEESESQLNKINIIQPSICAVQIALARLWMSWGIIPDCLAGHSMGEVAAAHISGALSLDDAARIICLRSMLMQTLSGKNGAMAVTELSLEEANGVADSLAGKICVAVHNSPKSTVFAGNSSDIDALLSDLENKKLFCRRVKVDVASHSSQMDAIKGDLRKALKDIKPKTATISLYSTVRVKIMDGTDLDADYWVDNLLNPVQFASVVERLAKENYAAFVEVSPHPVLTNAIQECVNGHNKDFGIFHSIHREKPEIFEFYSNLNELYTFGINPDWKSVYGSLPVNLVTLPGYPFDRENYELEKQVDRTPQMNCREHPLLGNSLKIAGAENIYYWENKIHLRQLPFLNDHKVNDTAVFPASAYFEMTLNAARTVFPLKTICLKNCAFLQALTIDNQVNVDIQVRVERLDEKHASLTIYSNTGSHDNSALWITHFTAEIFCDALDFECSLQMPGRDKNISLIPDLYKAFLKISVDYGSLFQNVNILEVTSQDIKASVILNSQAIKLGQKYLVNPVLLDNIIQPLFAYHFANDPNDHLNFACVSSVEAIWLSGEKHDQSEAYVEISNLTIDQHENRKTCYFKGDIKAFDPKHRTLMFYMKGVLAQVTDLEIPYAVKKDVFEEDNWRMRIASCSDDAERSKTIQTVVVQKVARLIKAQESAINPCIAFKSLGIDSIMAVQLRNLLEKEFGVKFAVSDLWKHPTIKDFSVFLNQLHGKQEDNFKEVCVEGSRAIITLKAQPQATTRLVCFHDAGGSISLFDTWDQLLGDEVEVICVQLPGRGDRTDEAPYTNITDYINTYIPLLKKVLEGKPFAVFGHSMGGLLAFETVRQLQYLYHMNATSLIISGTPCLKGYTNHFVNDLFKGSCSLEDFVSLLPSGLNIDLSNDYHRKMIETMRADFELIHSYQYRDGEKLHANITAFSATRDDRVSHTDVAAWKTETSGTFQLEIVEGEHNFVYTDKCAVISAVRQTLGIQSGVREQI